MKSNGDCWGDLCPNSIECIPRPEIFTSNVFAKGTHVQSVCVLLSVSLHMYTGTRYYMYTQAFFNAPFSLWWCLLAPLRERWLRRWQCRYGCNLWASTLTVIMYVCWATSVFMWRLESRPTQSGMSVCCSPHGFGDDWRAEIQYTRTASSWASASGNRTRNQDLSTGNLPLQTGLIHVWQEQRGFKGCRVL